MRAMATVSWLEPCSHRTCFGALSLAYTVPGFHSAVSFSFLLSCPQMAGEGREKLLVLGSGAEVSAFPTSSPPFSKVPAL